MQEVSEIIRTSDKVFWHGYIEFYERQFAGRSFDRIGEIGVLRGNSVRWLLERFPHGHVHGADIADQTPDWPTGNRVTYSQVDQSDPAQLRKFLAHGFDLLIEDGSHIPAHQALCLVEGVKALRPGGLYLLEDIHTSHPMVPRPWWKFARPPGNALSVLLGMDHYRRIGAPIDRAKAERIAAGSIISADDVQLMDARIESLELYRRAKLPNSCFRCGSSDYNFSAYRCKCGVNIFSDTDSMSFAINIRPN
jgi:hypothetical protein